MSDLYNAFGRLQRHKGASREARTGYTANVTKYGGLPLTIETKFHGIFISLYNLNMRDGTEIYFVSPYDLNRT